MSNPLDKIPSWLVFSALILSGIIVIIVGAVANPVLVKAILAGSVVVVIGVLSWIAGATAKASGRTGDIGIEAKLSNLPTWAWIVDGALVVGLSIAMFVIP